MFSIAISDLDLGIIIAGFGAICVIMGIIAYASMQTMKSVKAESRWKEFVFLGNKRAEQLQRVNSPFALQSMAGYLLLPPAVPRPSLSPSSQFQPSTLGMTLLASSSQKSETPPRQEVIAWSTPNPVLPTLRNDFADPEPVTSPKTSFAMPLPAAAPPPFEDVLETKPTTIPKLPGQQYRIVIQNGKKNGNNKRIKKEAGVQTLQKRRKNVSETSESKKELTGQVKEEVKATTLPAPLLPIEEAIEPVVTEPEQHELSNADWQENQMGRALDFSTQRDEIETPVISKRNIKSLINKSRRV